MVGVRVLEYLFACIWNPAHCLSRQRAGSKFERSGSHGLFHASMSLLRALPRRPLAAACCSRRALSVAAVRCAPPAPEKAKAAKDAPAPEAASEEPSACSVRIRLQCAYVALFLTLFYHSDCTEILSSCPAGTILDGVQWLKGQPPVKALPDEEYPAWLWTILQPKVLEDDGPGGKAEKVRLRKANRQRIREQNFMKTQ